MDLQTFDLTDFDEYVRKNPFMDYNHIRIVEISTDKSLVQMKVIHSGLNLNGAVHGGLLYTLADCVAGITARTDGRNYVTQSAHINFLRNVSEGVLSATGEIIKRGNSIAVVHVQIRNELGTLLSDASVDLFCTQRTI
ncbi:PaaI family thioesterase [Yanshouia hominis]|uniref:PaaI family thioesterase n=1 Tax=Yanshouia hominis TaxID=2763673 RepID=A0ABR7NEJ4_9FIRM|nr:PaaI family thioesterase [Yanshouia hominis]MBC8574837.1 PaaI family thioesterase [Yanshouia hominis]